MVYILNNLPQNISGTSTSGTLNMYFCQNSCSDLGNQNYVDFTLTNSYKTMISSKVDFQQTFSFSVGDHPGNPLPMSAIADDSGNILFFYMDTSLGYLSKKVKYPESIHTNGMDYFANIGMMVFASFFNDSKYIYRCNLENETTFQKIEGIFNTSDGTESGTTRECGQIGILFGHTLVAMGGSTGYLSFYYWDQDTSTLTYKNTYNDTKWTPWGDCGACMVKDSTTIYGAGATFKSGIISDDLLLNVIYSCTEDENHIVSVICNVSTMCNKNAEFISSVGVTHIFGGKCCLYQGNLQCLYIGSRDTSYGGILFGIDNTYNYYSRTVPAIQFVTSISKKTVFVYYGKTLERWTINQDSSAAVRTYAITENTVCIKLPGIPGVYLDTDKTNMDEPPHAYVGYLPYSPYYLPEGSVVNGNIIQAYSSTAATSRSPLQIQVSSNNFTKRIHSDLGNGTTYYFD